MYRLFGVGLLLVTTLSSLAQLGDMPPNAEPGKCYGKSIAPPSKAKPADTTYSTYSRYIGDREIKIVRRYHDVRFDATGRVQERVQVEVPKKLRKLPAEDIVIDTMYTYYAAVDESSGGTTFWNEIVCGSDVSARMVQEIADQLSNHGFQVNGVHEAMSTSLKKAMIEFQRKNELPIGQLDYQTLDALGVDY